MRIRKQRSGRGRELSVTSLFEAQVKPLAPILGICHPLNPLYFFAAARGTAHDAIRPSHLLDVGQALLISGELLMCFADIHRRPRTNTKAPITTKITIGIRRR